MTHDWLLVAGDLTPLGGMDAANHALAQYLATHGAQVHLVTHRAWHDLESLPGVTVHRVWRPWNRHLLGSPLLAHAGTKQWRRLRANGVRAIANGGNCRIADVNWVHYLHAAYTAPVNGSLAARMKAQLARRRDLSDERTALQSARLVICNSQRTRTDVIERLGVAAERAHVVYYGSDPHRFSAVTEQERRLARERLHLPLDRPLVGFVGALGDRRKAFDTVFAAWSALCGRRSWDAHLIVVGAGAELPAWQARAAATGLDTRMHFLGFRSDVPAVLAGLDLLVHPARYEAYGLSVHEAICRGLPAIVTRTAGVAERYPSSLSDLLLDDPDDANELAGRLAAWEQDAAGFRTRVAPLSNALRQRSWDVMGAEIASLVDRVAA